ncbi:MAG: hypothetical protein AAGC88_17095 [Bacteroidota bacterium]
MFETAGYDRSLPEEVFESWLEKGRSAMIGYEYLIVIWNQWDNDFQPVYKETREEVSVYARNLDANEELVAVYDLYSESRIVLND